MRSGLDLRSTVGVQAYLHVLSPKQCSGLRVDPKPSLTKMTGRGSACRAARCREAGA